MRAAWKSIECGIAPSLVSRRHRLPLLDVDHGTRCAAGDVQPLNGRRGRCRAPRPPAPAHLQHAVHERRQLGGIRLVLVGDRRRGRRLVRRLHGGRGGRRVRLGGGARHVHARHRRGRGRSGTRRRRLAAAARREHQHEDDGEQS